MRTALLLLAAGLLTAGCRDIRLLWAAVAGIPTAEFTYAFTCSSGGSGGSHR